MTCSKLYKTTPKLFKLHVLITNELPLYYEHLDQTFSQ